MVSVFNRAFDEHFPSLPTPASVPTPLPNSSFINRTHKKISVESVNRSLKRGTRQPFDAFLVLDVEATCVQGSDFSYPNEIIEWPVCLLKWEDRNGDNIGSKLRVVSQFRSFVQPTWRPTLSAFCTQLTGITQEQVDRAPTFPQVLAQFSRFLEEHGLISPSTGERLVRFCWCTDGPFDIRDFVVKQCFISKIRMPYWLQGDVMDVRQLVAEWQGRNARRRPDAPSPQFSLNISSQLYTLGLSEFEGRQHSGIDDTRNIARIVIELARRGVHLLPNTFVRRSRRWYWMGRLGEVIEEYVPMAPALTS